MESASMGLADNEGEEWELRHEDGFTYNILKRQRLFDPAEAVQPPVTDPKAEERHRKQRKKKILLKLKAQYQREIDQWELLSNSLRSVQDRAYQQQQQQSRDVDQTPSSSSLSLEPTSTGVEGNENASGSLIHELLLLAEAQEAVIHDVSYLCDVAESMCNAEKEWLAQSYIDLPVWSSPRKLMQSLCDE
ncbi:uncharacterized protein LOC8279097 [Ricinus communis]|uniref:uncharacterized protein LOC8279097 n=1 Tax=Ricinus communis TaxID=3988 RepID=UPI00201A7543|nr:uncharacterized protein LOC8279097 [Ricinus communis]